MEKKFRMNGKRVRRRQFLKEIKTQEIAMHAVEKVLEHVIKIVKGMLKVFKN